MDATNKLKTPEGLASENFFCKVTEKMITDKNYQTKY